MPEPPATSWWQAARWDDVRTLKSHAGDVNRRNGHGQTALHVAAGAGKEHAVKYLLSNGAAGSRRRRRARRRCTRRRRPGTQCAAVPASPALGGAARRRADPLSEKWRCATPAHGTSPPPTRARGKEVALRDATGKQARATAEEHVKDLIEQVRQHERRGHRAHAALAEIIGRPD